MKNPALHFASLLVLAGSPAAFAELPASPIRESEQAQAHIQGETKLLAETLGAMLGEYERNNLAGDDADAVRRVRGSLGSLSSTEMRQVVDLLQRARAATSADAAVKTVADAFTAQKQIVVAIQRILAEHLREQEAAEISRQLHGLADRQARNLQNGIELGRMMAGGPVENAEAVRQAQLETQRGEQSAIAEEVKMVRGKIARLAANPENAGAAESFKTAAKQIENVEPVVAMAAESLKAGQLFKAAADEKASRDELRKVARQIAPREQGPEALRKAERELGEVIAEQRQLRDATAQQKAQPDLDKWIAEKLAANDRNDALPQRLRNQPAAALRANPEIHSRFEKEQLEKAAELAKVEDQQGELAGRTDALAQKIAEVPQASTGLKTATGKMQEARAAMQDANAPQAALEQDAALAQLAAAQADLKRRADEAEARMAQQQAQNQPNNPANAGQMAAQMAAAVAQLAQAQQQVQQAQGNLQQAAQTAPGGSQQAQAKASMQQAAQQLAQASQSAAQAAAQSGAQSSPSAQQAMQQAAQQLSAATAQATGGQNSAAQQSAQSAAQSLAQAQASMAAQQAGLSPSQSGAPMPGAQGQGPGQGQKGQGTQPGQGQGQGPGKSSQASNGPSQGAENYTPGDPKAVERGAREAALKKADFIGLPARERAAIEQSLREKYPQEYGALVEQYLLNLANESAKK